jgi:hypothetical protein
MLSERSLTKSLWYFVAVLFGMLVVVLIDNGRTIPVDVGEKVAAVKSYVSRAMPSIVEIIPEFKIVEQPSKQPPKPKKPKPKAKVEQPREGWYIMLPPGDAHHTSPNLQAPLSSWTQGESFDSAEECESYRRRILDEAYRDQDRSSTNSEVEAHDYQIRLFTYADCVSQDDVRIKGIR